MGEDFTLGALKTHLYIGNIVISKIVISGFYPIHFTVTFPGTQHIYRYTGDIVISRIVVSGFHCSIDRPNLQVALERIEYITVDGKEVLYGPSDKMFFTTSLPFSCFGGFSSEILFFHCHYVPRIVHNKRKIPFISCLLSSRAENIYFISTTKKRYKKVNPECNIARAIKSG